MRIPLLITALTFGALLGSGSIGAAAEEGWTVMADMPTAKFGMSVVELDGKLFAIGGSQANARSATVEEYDPASDSWKSVADMPTARKGTAAAVIDGKIYVFGGTQVRTNGAIRTTESYDPATDTWTTKKDMPTARQGLTAVPVDGKIYVIGGWGVSTFESVVEVYDPATDTWEAKTNTPAADGNFGFAGVNGKVYLFCGTRNRTITREYDPVTDTWTTKAAIPHGRHYPSATVLDGKVYVLGGIVSLTNSPTDRMDIYDPVADTWTEGLKMPTARGNLSAVTLNGRIHAIGGLTGVTWGNPGTVYATVEVYNPVVDSDGDTLSDGDEVNVHNTNPVERDTDGDNFDDNVELALGTDPTDADDFPAQITAVQSGPWDSAATWSNNQAPTAENDYVLVGSVAAQLQTTAITFPGDSLTITGPGATLFSNHSGDASVADLIVENGAIEAGRNGSLGGRITMSGDNVINPGTATFTVNAAISGDGTLAIQSGDPGDPVGNVVLLGAGGAYAGSTTIRGTTLTIGGASAFAGDITLEGANLIVDAGQLIRQANLIIQGDDFSITLNSNLQVGDVIGLDASGAQVFSLRDLLELEPDARAELTAADLGEVFGNADLVTGDGLLILDSTVVADSVPFEIRDVRRMQVDESEVLEITFSSTPGASFAVETTTNLQDWAEVANGLATANADATTYRLQLTAPVANALYIRVRQE